MAADAVTANDPPPPALGIVWLDGETANVHGAAPACVTVTVCPAMLTVPVRAAPVFAATLTPIVALPVPPVRSSVIHGTPDAAVHVHVESDAVTGTRPDPPPSGTFWVVAGIEKVHVGAAAA